MNFLQTHLILSIFLFLLLGLVVGSFLNVVIIRYPEMLLRAWREECHELLNLPSEPPQPRFNLMHPRSQCALCRHPLRLWHNIPLLSYFMLLGRCGFCNQLISIQYPIVELLSAAASVAVFLKFGWSLQTGFLLLMSWGLIVLSVIDWKTQILPDHITLSLLWLGLLINMWGFFSPLTHAVIGAVCGYILLWAVSALFKLIRKKQGMGHGDFKMLAMLGAWLGFFSMIEALILAVFISLFLNLFLLFFKKIHRDQPLPFGPWLALGGWVLLLFGPF
jgi:leader peptidase (prepilin peptidase)/N-methyltransferase